VWAFGVFGFVGFAARRAWRQSLAANSGMVPIRADSFSMGNCMDPGEGNTHELPLHNLYVSGFYLDSHLMSYSLWTDVYQWGTNHSYSFEHAGSGEAASHLVQTAIW